MPSGSTFVFLLIGIVAVLMASNRVRSDVIALMVVAALILSDVLSVGAALSGFGSPVVVVIAGLLIVGEMLDRTGVARAVGDWILRRGGKSEIQLLVLIMISAGVLGSVMSSTAVVAIFIPIVMRVAGETGIAASRILIPMSYAALISGMMTLIATSSNVVVSGELVTAGYDGLGFFSFTLIGMAVLGIAVIYVVVFARHLLCNEVSDTSAARRSHSIPELWVRFREDELGDAVEITAESPLAGLKFAETALDTEYGVRVLYRVRRDRRGREVPSILSDEMELRPGDLLVIAVRQDQLERLVEEKKLRRFPTFLQSAQRWMWEMGAAEVLVHPDADIIGQTVAECEFRTRYGLKALGLRRGGNAVADYEQSKLAAGDGLLLIGPWSRIEALRTDSRDFVVLGLPPEREQVVEAYDKAPIALAILGAIVLLSVFDIVPLVVSVLCAAIAAVVTGCLSAEQAYRAVRLSSLILVAGMLPLADALQETEGTTVIVEGLLDVFGEAAPGVMMTVLFALTALLGMVLSTTASAVLVSPIAIAAADALGASPYPFAVAVLIGASAAYSTPMSTPVVALVVEPGRYAFMDFVKVGVPLLVLTCIVTVLITPLLFPF